MEKTLLNNCILLEKSDLKIVWTINSIDTENVWIERVGDWVIKKVSHKDLISLYELLRSKKLQRIILSLVEKEVKKPHGHIYDVHYEKEGDGSWYKLYRTSIHTKNIKREEVVIDQY